MLLAGFALFIGGKLPYDCDIEKIRDHLMRKNTTACYYPDYLQLEKILQAQNPVSKAYGHEAHDEMLFIITHQAYEIWFKQILHELHSITPLFAQDNIHERDLEKITHRLKRITVIQKVLLQQLAVIETMTPLDFLDFRDYLIPASGFQSIQFKEIEIILGLKSKYRVNFDQKSFYARLREDHRDYLLDLESKPSLLELVDIWLSRIPFLQFEHFDFWLSYEKAVDNMLDNDKKIIQTLSEISTEERNFQLTDLDNTRANFAALLDADKYQQLQQTGKFRFSRKSLLSAVFINLYREEPMLQAPFQLLTTLLEIDEGFTQWRSQHVLMVHRMLGSKIGTGGSSGHEYLQQTTQNNKFFSDLFNLSTFLIPRSALPILPDSLKRALDYHYQEKG